VEHAREQYEVSERRACRVVRQWRGTQRYLPLRRTDEDQLTQAILALAAKYGRYGYRRITALLQHAGWPVGKDRVQRIWRREGLKASCTSVSTRPVRRFLPSRYACRG
jgi:putative transposase